MRTLQGSGNLRDGKSRLGYNPVPRMPTIIAVDAMGSDRAPKPEVEGAILACRNHDVAVKLIGREAELRKELALHRAHDLPIQIVNATEVIGMNEKAMMTAVRRKADSSMRVGL